MVELRKRKAAAVPTRAPPKKKPDPVQKAVEKAESPLAGEPGRAKMEVDHSLSVKLFQQRRSVPRSKLILERR